jgi:hypothetical protein
MVRSKRVAQGISLVYSLLAVCLCFTNPEITAISLHPGGGIASRFSYPFFHTSFLHAMMNCWCLISIVFIYDVSLISLIAGYATAITYPVGLLSQLYSEPHFTIGFSGVCYYLLGRVSLNVKEKAYWQICICTTILIGFIFPHTIDVWLHVYCYMFGLIGAFLNKKV